ncbi:MAG: NAD(P)-binding protein [Verrucomicrobiota bacterium]|nr:NAD(P)-binding protein [Verrucomicrobiota bacterium]
MDKYDVAIIGAGMSGIAAGIRLAHFGKKVCIFERHYAPGGLNSFYALDGRKYDVGLHAMTNFVKPGIKAAPLNRILRQLRIRREDLNLSEQKRSRIAFREADLKFSNDFELLLSEIDREFPDQVDGFRELVEDVKSFDDSRMDYPYESARKYVQARIANSLLEDMIFCPLLYYGSSTEEDMDFGQFVVMFKSIFLEGFARPFDGIRGIIKLLLKRYREVGGIRRMNTGIAKIEVVDGRAEKLILDSGEEVEANVILSSAGLPETNALCSEDWLGGSDAQPGKLSFTETISTFGKPMKDFGWGEDAIVFFNGAESFHYRSPENAVDLESGVICVPDNFDYTESEFSEGIVRVTCLANYDLWKSYPEIKYMKEKEAWRQRIWKSAKSFMPETSLDYSKECIAFDMFTPTTVERYTWRKRGAIYGSAKKYRTGVTPISNLFLCGTDQGFLGIVGSMLSGIAMANAHALR